MRVFDLGALVVWLFWLLRQRDEPEDGGGREGPGRGPPPGPSTPPGPGGRGIRLLPDSGPWPLRIREHGSAHPHRIERRGVPARRERSPV